MKKIDSRTAAIRKIKGMKKQVFDYILEESARLLKCGGIDPENFDPKEFALAKIILCVALKNCSDQYHPMFDNFREDMKNLENF
jgi:hypothetical protein